jgi:hypothetical protein
MNINDYIEQQRPAYVHRMKRRRAREHAQLHPAPRLHPTTRLHPTQRLHLAPTAGNLRPRRREEATCDVRPKCPAEHDTAGPVEYDIVDTAQAATARVSRGEKLTKALKSDPRLVVNKCLEMKWKLSAERKLLWCCGGKNWKEYQKPYEERRRKSLPLSQREERFDAGG